MRVPSFSCAASGRDFWSNLAIGTSPLVINGQGRDVSQIGKKGKLFGFLPIRGQLKQQRQSNYSLTACFGAGAVRRVDAIGAGFVGTATSVRAI